MFFSPFSDSLIPTASHAKKKPFDRIVVFGTSLSDPGNAFIINQNPTLFNLGGCDLTTPLNVPPYDELDDFLIPDGVYARGGHHVSNGATWIEQYARSQAMAGYTRPALHTTMDLMASNYAVGGARAAAYPCRFNLLDQLAAYKKDFPATSPQTLIVIEMGSNDVRDMLVAATDDAGAAIFTTALENIAYSITTLYAQGARNFLVLNVPAIDKTPALLQMDALLPGTADQTDELIQDFNEALTGVLTSLLDLPQINIVPLDIYSLLNDIVDSPQDYGIINVEETCVTPNIPPYTCSQPDTFLFWDGIHPTKAVHALVAERASQALNAE